MKLWQIKTTFEQEEEFVLKKRNFEKLAELCDILDNIIDSLTLTYDDEDEVDVEFDVVRCLKNEALKRLENDDYIILKALIHLIEEVKYD